MDDYGDPTFTQLLSGISGLDRQTSEVITIDDSEEQTETGSSLGSPSSYFRPDSQPARSHQALWTLPLSPYGRCETHDILPFCTNGFAETLSPRVEDLDAPSTSRFHRTVAQVHRTAAASPEKVLGSENVMIQEHAFYGCDSDDSYTNPAEYTRPEDSVIGSPLSRIPQKSNSPQAYTVTEDTIYREEDAEKDADVIHTPWLETSHWLDSTLPPVTLSLSNHTETALTSNQSCSGDDEVFKYRAYTVTYLLVFPIALLFNSGALFVFLRLMPKRSPSSILMTNLALSDACFSLTLPFRLAYYFRGAHWDLPDWLCRLCVFCFYLNLYTSILFLTGLSVLRLLAVLKPLHHRALATPHRASLACLGIWLFVGGTSVPFLFSGTRVRAGLTRCFEPRNSASWKRIFILNYVGVTFGFLIPFVTILGCYGSIIRRLTATAISQKLQTGSLKRSQGRRRHQSLRLVAMVICTFLLCFLPYHVARSMHLRCYCNTAAGVGGDAVSGGDKQRAEPSVVLLCRGVLQSGHTQRLVTTTVPLLPHSGQLAPLSQEE